MDEVVSRNEAANRFELRIGRNVAFLEYEIRGATIDLVHTAVPLPLRGHGAGERLAQAALEFARAEHLTVIPTCPFIASYLERHPEYQSLVHHG